MDRTDFMRAQAQRIARSGGLGKSQSYPRLLDYLIACTLEGRAPKELEIAREVFGKGPDFDPSQDSLVRVYAHNLRQKLDHYYATVGRDEAHRLTVPRGEYRVLVAPLRDADPPPAQVPAANVRLRLAGGIALFALGFLVSFALGPRDRAGAAVYRQAAQSAIWADLLDDAIPTLLVVGDYYIFAELDERAHVARLVRDFDINSSKDLDDLLMYEPELLGKYLDLDLTYLPRASAFAVTDLLRVLYTSDKPVRVTSMSELNVADLKSHHVVYVGYISALDKLMEFVFASSGLAVGDTFDELSNKQTRQRYTSGGGLPPADQRHYRDYGLFSTFPGPGGNQFVIIAGTRDAGLMHTAYVATDPMHVSAMVQTLPGGETTRPPAFEVLYEVTGFNRTSLDAMPVYAAALDYRTIWGGELTRVSTQR